jgi:hypothetical protein
MTKQPSIVYSERPVVILDLPLAANTRLLNPDQVMLKIDNLVHDVGAFCYSVRTNKMRRPGKPREVVLGSFRRERVNQIKQVIMVFSSFLKDAGMRQTTVQGHQRYFRRFMDWSDANGCPDCLVGGDATRNAYRQFAQDVEDRFRRHEFESANAYSLQTNVLTVLEALTGLSDLGKGVRFIKDTSWNKRGTEPLAQHDFAHVLALNDSMFQGLSDLVLDHQPFPFKLSMPKSLGWKDDFLWVFPTPMWILPPHQWGVARTKLNRPSWPQDYENGRLATVDEISCHYGDSEGLRKPNARKTVTLAAQNMEAANSDKRSHYRRLFAAAAHKAFYLLFLAHTGANASVVKDIETDGTLEESSSNPGYRSVKWRARGKEISVIIPLSFVPSLRRYMELRKYLLNGKAFPYLFMNLGGGNRSELKQVNDNLLQSQYMSLARIDPLLPRMGVHKIRATVSNYYKQKHDSDIEVAVLQHKETTTEKSYNSGTEADHHFELSLLMEKIAEKAQQIEAKWTNLNARTLEDGGVCQSYGQPEPLSNDVPVKPNCKTGCLFCAKRVLIAGEEDARKVASAAFLMEQLISGPLSEAEFRPQIVKCDEDLAKIRAFEDCEEMVDRVYKDVYENGNLTPYFADKFQLFLSLGVL